MTSESCGSYIPYFSGRLCVRQWQNEILVEIEISLAFVVLREHQQNYYDRKTQWENEKNNKKRTWYRSEAKGQCAHFYDNYCARRSSGGGDIKLLLSHLYFILNLKLKTQSSRLNERALLVDFHGQLKRSYAWQKSLFVLSTAHPSFHCRFACMWK